MSWKDWFTEPSYIFFATNANDFAKIIDAISRETEARAHLKDAQAKLEAAHHFKNVRDLHVHHHHYGDAAHDHPDRLGATAPTPQLRPWVRHLLTDGLDDDED